MESVSGPAGGYRPGRGLRLPPLLFSPAEALALVMAVLDGHHDVADGGNPAGDALRKSSTTAPSRAVSGGSTSTRGRSWCVTGGGTPWWYAERLGRVPVPFEVLGGPELQATTRAVGSRLLAAATVPSDPSTPGP